MTLCGLAAPRGRFPRRWLCSWIVKSAEQNLYSSKRWLPFEFHQLEPISRHVRRIRFRVPKRQSGRLQGSEGNVQSIARLDSPPSTRSTHPARGPRPRLALSPRLLPRLFRAPAVFALLPSGRPHTMEDIGCLVCGLPASLRCSRCGQGGKDRTGRPIDLRFCSTEHQRLVRLLSVAVVVSASLITLCRFDAGLADTQSFLRRTRVPNPVTDLPPRGRRPGHRHH